MAARERHISIDGGRRIRVITLEAAVKLLLRCIGEREVMCVNLAARSPPLVRPSEIVLTRQRRSKARGIRSASLVRRSERHYKPEKS
jgi:hypothetical protein